jgi:hypothetical protein
MGQFGFFDAERRLGAITAKGDPLEMIARVVPYATKSPSRRACDRSDEKLHIVRGALVR